MRRQKNEDMGQQENSLMGECKNEGREETSAGAEEYRGYEIVSEWKNNGTAQ